MSALPSPVSAVPVPDSDKIALHRQLTIIERQLQDGAWHTIAALAKASGASEAGASARIRDCRRLGWNVVRVRVGPRLWAYSIVGRAPLTPAKKKPADSRLDALEQTVRELRAAVESLQSAGRGE